MLGGGRHRRLSRTHAEIEYQIGRLHKLLTGLTDQNAHPQDIIELRRLLYGLYAVLRLHNAQEDESATPHTRQPSILELDAHLDRELRVNVSKTNLRGPKQELQYSGVRIPTIAGNVPQFRGDLLRRSDGRDNPGRS